MGPGHLDSVWVNLWLCLITYSELPTLNTFRGVLNQPSWCYPKMQSRYAAHYMLQLNLYIASCCLIRMDGWCGGVVFTPVASSFGLVFSVWFGPAGEQLGLQIIRPHYSGEKRPDSDVRMRRAFIITPRLTASREPIFLYSHSQNWFKVFTTSVSNIQCIQVNLLKVWGLVCV